MLVWDRSLQTLLEKCTCDGARVGSTVRDGMGFIAFNKYREGDLWIIGGGETNCPGICAAGTVASFSGAGLGCNRNSWNCHGSSGSIGLGDDAGHHLRHLGGDLGGDLLTHADW